MEVAMMSLARIVLSVASVALGAATLAQAEALPLRDHGAHVQQQSTHRTPVHPQGDHARRAHQRASAGYAASPADTGAPVDTGAQCRAQVREIWPAAPTIIGGGERTLEMLFDACMANGGRIP